MMHSEIQMGRGHQGHSPLLVQFLSFSCSFWQESCQIIGFYPKFRDWHPLGLGNPEYATVMNRTLSLDPGVPWGCLPRGCMSWGASARGMSVCLGVSDWGVSSRGCLPDTPLPCEQNDWQTPVKILPCRNFVEDSNKESNWFICSECEYSDPTEFSW